MDIDFLKIRFNENSKMQMVSEAAYQTLREAIIKNYLSANTRVRDDEIAAIFNISRTPVREALLLLQHNDFIINDTAKGCIVKGLNLKEVSDLICYSRSLRRFNAESLAKIITPSQIALLKKKKLTKEILDMQKCLDFINDVYIAHQDFHLTIAEKTMNYYLYKESIKTHEKLLMCYYTYKSEIIDFPIESYINEQDQLIAAFAAHDHVMAEKIVNNYSDNIYLVVRKMYNINWENQLLN